MKKTLIRVLLIILCLLGLLIASYKSVTKPFDNIDEIIASYYSNTKTTEQINNLDDIPDTFKNSILYLLDKDFYQHIGLKKDFIPFYFSFIFPSYYDGPSSNPPFSQIISDTVFYNGEYFPPTFQKAISSLRIDSTFSKDQIFLLVVNSMDFRNNVFGLYDASFHYFNKPYMFLSEAEIVFLAVMARISYFKNVDNEFVQSIYYSTQITLFNQNIISQVQTREEISEFIVNNYL